MTNKNKSYYSFLDLFRDTKHICLEQKDCDECPKNLDGRCMYAEQLFECVFDAKIIID